MISILGNDIITGYICRKQATMETTRIQTVLRLPPELMDRVKRGARKEKCSFNSYVERILDEATAESSAIPMLPAPQEMMRLNTMSDMAKAVIST